MNPKLLLVVTSCLIVPIASSAIGFGGYYSIGIPFVDYDSLGCGPDFSGVNVKAWYDLSDEVGLELSSGFYEFPLQTDYQLESDEVGKVRLWNMSLGVKYVIKKFGRFKTYINGGGGYFRAIVQDDRMFIPENPPKDKYENPGIHIGGGLKAWLGGPLYADVNPVFSYVFDVDKTDDGWEVSYLNRLYMFAINIGLGVDF